MAEDESADHQADRGKHHDHVDVVSSQPGGEVIHRSGSQGADRYSMWSLHDYWLITLRRNSEDQHAEAVWRQALSLDPDQSRCGSPAPRSCQSCVAFTE